MSEWISVDDRLPDENQVVVVARFYEYVEADLAVCQFINEDFTFYSDAVKADACDGCYSGIYLDMEATHWMPLPEPPANKLDELNGVSDE